jgi:hypothetical protein
MPKFKIDFAKIYDDPGVSARISKIIKKNSCDCPRCRAFYYDEHFKPAENGSNNEHKPSGARFDMEEKILTPDERAYLNDLCKEHYPEKPKMSDFDYIKYDGEAHKLQLQFKSMFQSLKAKVEELPHGRAKSLVCTKLEEAYMWVGKAIRDHQIEREKNER